MAWFTYTSLIDGMVLTASDLNTPLSNAANGTVTVAHGGTGLTAGTSGGVPYFTSTSAIGSSGALTQYGIVYGQGAASAPATTAAGTTGQVLVATTSAAPAWGVGTLRAYLAGLGTSYVNGTTYGVAVGVAADTTAAYMMTLGSAYTKTTAAWSVGTGNGSLDTGALANATWYHIYLIRRSDTGVVDLLMSTSATAPTMPTSYDAKRLLWSFRTAAGATTLLPFVQDGDYGQFTDPTTLGLDFTSTNPGTSAVTRTLNVPTGYKVRAEMNVELLTGGTTQVLYLSDLATTDVATAHDTTPLGPVGSDLNNRFFGQVVIQTNTSAQIRSRMSASGAGTVIYLQTVGWYYTRGRDA